MQCSSLILHVTPHKTFACSRWVLLSLHQQQRCQWFKSLLTRNLRFGSSLWFKGQIQVFQHCIVPAIHYPTLQLLGKFSLFAYCFQNSFLAFVGFCQTLIHFRNMRNLQFVKISCALLSVSCNKRNGATFVQ